MTPQKYNRMNTKKTIDLAMNAFENSPRGQIEKDIFNLKYMLYGIKHGSRFYRSGCVATLKRAIRLLEIRKHERK